mmetsp:Transcript_69101/g.191229  ORF Transcript_69101/g.191229 Transcript_69101/m.191229 type:complete len:349 (-) Transcript_69101:54-1100(-)
MAVDVLGLPAWTALWPFHLVVAERHLGLPEEDGEVVAAAVQWVHLPDLQLIIRQEKEDYERPPLELRRGDVVHDREETQDLPVVLQELLHVRVDVAATKHDLAVYLLVGPWLRRRCNLDRLPGLHPGIRLLRCRGPLLHASLLVVGTGELIAIRDHDGLPIYLQYAAHLQVFWLDVTASRCREAVPADQLALRDAAIVLPGLLNMAGVVLQVVEHDHLADSVVLEVCLDDRLLEVPIETKHVPVVGVPRRQVRVAALLHAGLEVRACGAVRQGARPPVLGGTHGLDKLGLFMGQTLLALDKLLIHDVPCLGLVVVLLLLREGETRQVGQQLQISHAHGPCGMPASAPN